MKVGKINADTFSSIVLSRLGKYDPHVIVPPRCGIDAGVIDLCDGRVLVVAEDPIFTVPGLPLEMFGWFTVHIGASDIAVMGVKPQFMTYSLLLPQDTSNEDLMTIIDSIHRTALELDVAIVGGHTGYYPGFTIPTIGGITVFGITKKEQYVTPAGAQPENVVILTKGPAIETAGLLSIIYEKELLKNYPESLVKRAQKLCKSMSVVKDALIAMDTGGVTAMHDATEGGVIGGLYELAVASEVGMKIDESKFILPSEVQMVCEALSIDPVSTIAEGSLLITAKKNSSNNIIGALQAEEIEASVIGEVTDDPTQRIMKRCNGTIVSLSVPAQDPFWNAFFNGMKNKSNIPNK